MKRFNDHFFALPLLRVEQVSRIEGTAYTVRVVQLLISRIDPVYRVARVFNRTSKRSMAIHVMPRALAMFASVCDVVAESDQLTLIVDDVDEFDD
jgi:hypothetical protein